VLWQGRRNWKDASKMTGEIRKVALASVLGAFFFVTSQDARVPQLVHGHMMGAEAPVCSDKPVADSVQRMKAIQSLRETQVEVEMMKQHQAAAGATAR
jgi:hypothetical protein